jgi:hypothetical protein
MGSRDRAAAILARFPGPVTLYSSRKKWAFLLVFFLFWVGLGVFGFFSARAKPEATLGEWATVWGLIILGSSMALLSVLMMNSRLQLDKDGFLLMHPLGRRKCAWRDVADFISMPVTESLSSMVRFHHSDVEETGWHAKLKALTHLNSSLGDNFGLKAQDLADLMTEWKRRAEEREAA